MEPWRTTLVALVAVNAVVATPLLQTLPPGQTWPPRNSVKQPSTYYGALHNETIEEDAFLIEKDTGTEEPEEVTIIPRLVPGIRADNDDKVDYTGAQVWQVNTNKTGVRAVLYRLRRRNLISTWGGNQSSVDILIKPQALGNVSRVFNRENIVYNVIIDDLQQRINEENPPLDENELELQDRRARSYNFWRYRATRRRVALLGAYMGYNSVDLPMEYWRYANWGHRMTWKQYHRLEDIYGFLNYLAKTYPALVTIQSVGKSHQGRDLMVLKISNGNSKNKAVFIDGGIHAREWISPATVTYFINQFGENFDIESDDVKNIDWYFMPVVNPDGYEFTHTSDRLWRKNRRSPPVTGRVCSGIDLNRNFGYKWGGKGSSNNPCSEIYGGRKAFSEPESKALADFITNSVKNFSAYLTYHSYGQYLLYPWGYENVVPPDYQDLDKVGKKIAQAVQEAGGSVYKVGSSSGLLYPASGGSDDWAKAQGIKYAFTIELSDTGRYGFVLPTSYIEPVAKESLAGLRVLANQLSKE